MTQHFNYRHLHYFWVVAKEGSMTKAASRLNIAVQTVSSQVHELEKDLGHLLFKPAGRGLVLTDAGFAAMKLADQIFQIGEKLPSIVSGSGNVVCSRTGCCCRIGCCWRNRCCRSRFQQAIARVMLPMVVRAAWNTTSPLSEGLLSNRCQVQAAMALIRAGTIARASQRQPPSRRIAPKVCTATMAASHSSTDVTWIHQVPRDRACMERYRRSQ